ncbi:MAG: carbohydrate ABC transporter permease [Fimbriimonadaceae bacterium]
MGLLRGRAMTRRHAGSAILAGRVGRAVTLAVLIIGVMWCLVPLYVMATIAFKSPTEIATTSIWAFPRHLTLANFREVLGSPNVVFSLLFKNTLFIAVLNTVGVVATSSLAAYAFGRLRFAGRDRLFLVLLSTMMLPGIVTMIPSYVVFAKIGWVNTYLPLTVPAFFGGGAFNIFLLRQFFGSIPRELDEAAVLDGAGHWTIFRRVILPLSGPALATVGVYTFVGAWRDFMGPLLYLNDSAKQTLEVGLSTYNALRGEKINLMMAASLMVMLPLIALFLVGQRYFVRGIVMTGLK